MEMRKKARKTKSSKQNFLFPMIFIIGLPLSYFLDPEGFLDNVAEITGGFLFIFLCGIGLVMYLEIKDKSDKDR